MMKSSKAVEFQAFFEWADATFKEMKVKNGKIRLHSVYCDDDKYHLWCRPYTGHYHCYKSGKKGSLYDLVMDVDKCSYAEAVDALGGKQTLRYLESKLEEFFSGGIKEDEEETPEEPKLMLPDGCIPVNKLMHPYQNMVLKYLEKRKIPPDGLYYCIKGDFEGRIVIPYRDSDGTLIYFNARDIIRPKPFLRYRGPDGNTGFKKEEVVWMSFFPKKGSKIYLTEGEFDAMTLNSCGLHGCATGGKEVSQNQMWMIMDYDVCLAFDRDPSGKEAFQQVGARFRENGIKNVSFIRPPEPYKDWNEMLTGGENKQALSPNVIKAYIQSKEKPFDEYTSCLLNF